MSAVDKGKLDICPEDCHRHLGGLLFFSSEVKSIVSLIKLIVPHSRGAASTEHISSSFISKNIARRLVADELVNLLK